ncbi:MAG: BlaI/MecI/CopY family transcriptional regulator [Oscillospiraceae bacterium]|nr:BlaI/MecI/CopY family transcriptional regulator [Oscillospiraceae bacterium]
MNDLHLSKSELAFVEIVWEETSISTRDLVEVCAEQFSWKSTTTYTVLRRLCDRGILKKQDSLVTALISKSEFQQYSSQKIVRSLFNGSLPEFIAAFTGGQALCSDQLDEIENLLNQYKEKNHDGTDT